MQHRDHGVGNTFAVRAGHDAAAPVVFAGSHIDTQPSGGKFDGNYGVLAGLEVLRTLNDVRVATNRPVGVAIWTNEEGSRFVPVMGGSGAFAGVFTAEQLRAQRDVDGVSFGEALAQIGYAGPAPVGGRALDAYFEAHIEQGPILEREGKVIGVVTGVDANSDAAEKRLSAGDVIVEVAQEAVASGADVQRRIDQLKNEDPVIARDVDVLLRKLRG